MRDPKHPRQFTEEFRRQIVALVDSGKPRAEVMREYDLGKSTLDRWIRHITFSLLSRSFSRLSRRRSSAIWKGFASASGAAAEALLTQSARLDGSTPISRATSA